MLPVSAKNALEAKLRVGGAGPQKNRSFMGMGEKSGVVAAVNPNLEELARDAQWAESGFGAAEQWVFNFLGGGVRTRRSSCAR